MLRKKIITCVVATIISGLAITETASADQIGDCSLTGYAYMAGNGANVSTPTGPAYEKDYFLAQPLSYYIEDNPNNFWGFAWGKFDNLAAEPVGSAYLVFDLLGVGGMAIEDATAEYPGTLDIYSPGDLDVADLPGDQTEGIYTLCATLRDTLDNSSSPLFDTIVMPSNGTYSVDITDLYNGWIDGTIANHGLVFVSNGENSSGNLGSVGCKIAGFGHADGNAPYISTASVPEPSSLLLLAMGIGALTLLKKLRKTA